MRISLTVLGLMGVASCAVGPDFERPAPPSFARQYTAPDEQMPVQAVLGRKITGEWWHLFESADLNTLISMALEHNQDLEAAKAALAQVRQKAAATEGLAYPQVGLHGGATREKVNFTSYGMSFPSETLNLYSIGGTVSYALDLFGHDRRSVEAAEADAEAETYRLNGAYLTLTGTVVMRVLSAASLKEQAEIVSSLIAMDQRRVDLMRTARRAGTISDKEMADAEGQLAVDGAMLPPVLAQLSGVRHELSVLVGKTPEQWSPPDFELSAFIVPQNIPLSLPSDLVRHRPDILAAEADLHVASALIGVAEANRYPRLVLSADITQWAVMPGQLWRDAATGAGVGAGLTAPIFQGGRLEAEQHAAESAYNVSFAKYRQTVLQSFAQVATVLQGLVQDERAVTLTGKAVVATVDSRRYAEMERLSGTSGILPVLVAERQEKLARLADVQSRVQYLKDSADLFLAMGGGWWDRS